MKMIRRLVAIVLACVLPAAAFAQAYPSRPIALVVPFAPALLGRGPLLLVVNKDLGPRDLGEQLRHELDGWRRVVHEGGLRID